MEADEHVESFLALSPEEEDAFAAIARQVERGGPTRIPWAVVVACVGVVGAGVTAALLLGAPIAVVGPFCATFTVGLTAGLVAIALRRRKRLRPP